MVINGQIVKYPTYSTGNELTFRVISSFLFGRDDPFPAPTPPANQREVGCLDSGILNLDLHTTPSLSHTCKPRHEAALKSS